MQHPHKTIATGKHLRLKQLKSLEHTLATCVKHMQRPNKKTLANIYLKTNETFLNKRLQHASDTLATSRSTFATST
jgi:hypothetical protein